MFQVTLIHASKKMVQQLAFFTGNSTSFLFLLTVSWFPGLIGAGILFFGALV